jgi:putative membrane protein
MILGLLISALWNPQERLDTVKAAIVNLDEPVEVNGQTVPLGRQLAAGLVSGGETADAEAGEATAVPASDASYDWQITDEAGAADGLADGTYAAVVTIPKDFSAAATSFSGADPTKAEQATIDVATPANGRVLDDALAQVVAQTATGVLGSTLTETYVDNVLVGFSTLSEELGKAADGADQLADGATEAGKGAKQLADGADELASGATEAGGGARELADGADELASGATEAGAGAQELAAGAHQTSEGVSGIGQGATGLAGGAGQWAAGADHWAAGADQVSSGVVGLASGASSLADGTKQVSSGVGRSADGAMDLAQGASQLSDGASELSGGASELSDGASRLAIGAQGAADGASQLAGGAADVSTGVSSLVAEAEKVCADPSLVSRFPELCLGLPEYQKLPGGAEAVAQGLGAMADKNSRDSLYGLAAGASSLSGGASELAGGASQLAGGAKELSAGNKQLAGGLGQLQSGSAEVASGASALADGSARLASGASDLASGARELSGGAGGLASGASELASGAGQLAVGSNQLATGVEGLAGGVTELGTGTTQLATGVEGLAGGVTELGTGTTQLATGVEGLADGVTELGTGTTQLATGVDGLADGVGELAGGATDLSDGLGKATEEIPSYTEQERKSLASVVADPVATDGEVTDLDTGATGPMFAVLALWLGALALMIVFSPVPLHARGSTRGALRLTLETFAIPAVIGLATGLATGAVLAGIEDLDAGGWIAAMGFGALASLAFVAVNQALAAALGHVGRGISLLVAVLVIATGVVSTVPGVLEGLAAFLPVGSALDGLVGLTESGVGGVTMAIAAMVLWGIAGLAVTTLMVARQRTVRVGELLRTA